MGWLDDFRRRQSAYVASPERIADAQLAISENKLLGGGDPSCDAILLAACQEALNHLLEIAEHQMTEPACLHEAFLLHKPDA
jgi:hypothetical protein